MKHLRILAVLALALFATTGLAAGPAADHATPGTQQPEDCWSFCDWYCYNEYEFCMSGCEGFLCEITCSEQWQDCYTFCTLNCF
jgi:hypothetical protein